MVKVSRSNKFLLTTFLLLSVLFIVLAGCVGSVSYPPEITILSPQDGAALDLDSPQEIELQWKISEKELHSWTVDVYFGEEGATPTKIVSNQMVESVKVNVELDKDYTWKVIAKDSVGRTSEKAASFTTGKGKLRVYVAQYNSGPAVEGATIIVRDHETGEEVLQSTTDEEGKVVLNVSELPEKIDIEAEKSGYALSKIVGIKVVSARTKPVEMQLRVAALNPDPSSQEYPTVQVELLDMNGEPLTEPATETFQVHVAVESENHVSVIYCSLGKVPGSSFFGPRSIASDTNEATFTIFTTGWNGETELNIVVYDYNDNRVHVVEYVDITQGGEEPEYVFLPVPPALLGYVNLVAYTRNDALEFYSAKNILNKRDQEMAKIHSNSITKDLGTKLTAAPEGSNLFVEVTWLDYDTLYYYGLLGPLAEEPDGYNIYRSFDGVRYQKIGFVSSGYNFYDSSPQLAPGKETWYAVSSVYGSYESEKVYLGSVVPLDSFRVNLIEPEDGETEVSRQPTFSWQPTKLLITPESTVDYYYTIAIYDAIQSDGNIMVPVYEKDGQLYLQEWYAPDDRMIQAKFDDYQWYYLGLGLSPYDKLEAYKTYDWGVDYAIAISEDRDSQSFSISIDYGWGIDPIDVVLPEKHNEFTTGLE